MIAPNWEGLFEAVDELVLPERSYPYGYQDLPLIKLFVYARIKGITAFQSLQKHLTLRPEVLAPVGLEKAPHRKTLAARFRALSTSALSLLHQLSERFSGRPQHRQRGLDLNARQRECLAQEATRPRRTAELWQYRHPSTLGQVRLWQLGLRVSPAHADALWSRRHPLACHHQRPRCQPQRRRGLR